MEKFEVNGKTYFARDLDFEFLVTLDKNGVSVDKIAGLAAVNCFLAYCGRMPEEKASKEISEHMINGGTLDAIIEVYTKCLQESDFFRAVLGRVENEQTETAEDNGETQETTRKRSKRASE